MMPDSPTDDSAPNYGTFSEQYVLRAAAWGGQPDFVFPATNVPKGNAQREIGDALVWVGKRLVVVSVKSRDPAKMGQDTEDRARSWLDTQIKKASKQIDGTIRKLRSADGDIKLTNMRGVEVPWNPSEVEEYLGVIVVNYSPPPAYVPSPSSKRAPVVGFQVRDWQHVCGVLWSSTLLAGYVKTRSMLPSAPLDSEKDMLGHVIAAEQSYSEIALPGGQPKRGMWDETVAQFPDADSRNHPDARFAYVIDAVMAAMAEDPKLYDISGQPWGYIGLVRLLDQIPLLERVEMGRDMIERCARAGRENSRVTWLTWPTRGRLGLQIVFAADGADRATRIMDLTCQVHTRHAELQREAGFLDLVTLGVATEPYPLSGGSHDFVVFAGDAGLSAAEIADRETRYSPPTFPSEVLESMKGLAAGGPA